ncbi:MAG: AtpZ/AtpI family protein [Bacteroidota bacterium]
MKSQKKRPLPDYLRYTGLGFEFLACILLFVGAGYALDNWLETEKPWFMLVFSLLGSAAAIYLVVRKFLPPNKR